MRRTALIVAVLSLGMLTACGDDSGNTAGSSGKTITLRISNVSTSPDQFFNKGLRDWADAVSERTGGKLKLEIYMGTITTDEAAEVNSVKTGALDGAITSASPVAALYPKLGVLDLWFAFDGYEALDRTLQGQVGDELLQGVTQSGVTGLSFWYSSFFQLGTLERVLVPDDVNGLKIRVLQSPVSIAYTKAMGANATPLAYGEVYSGLQTHLIEGVTSNWSGFTNAKLHEQLKNVLILNCQAQAALLVMNSPKFNSLPVDYQRILKETAKEIAPKELKYVQDSDASGRKTMEDAGVEITTPTDDQLGEWVERAKAVDAQFEPQFGQDLIDKIRNANQT